jgi:KipI family sensor histidine kinase inhibitor
LNAIPRILPLGEQGLTVEFGESIDLRTNELGLSFAAAVERATIPGVMEVVPTYRSATIYFNPLLADRVSLIERVHALLTETIPEPPHLPSTHRIPVFYGGETGPDLIDVADRARLASADVIAIHSSVIYRVYMLGFSPGFPYLGTVPDRIATPRLSTPRKLVRDGSVGIAGAQTGIYPQASPGGWRIIGRTPVRLFAITRPKPFLFAPGDQVQFVPIDEKEFLDLSADSP